MRVWRWSGVVAAVEARVAGRGGPWHLLREAEVRELHVAVDVDHHVLGLEVAEDDALRVHVLEREGELGRVDPRLP